MSEPTYPPLDVLKPVAPDLWIVDSGPLRTMGMPLPVRMTVVRLPDGGIWLHSPTRYDAGLQREIEAEGPIRHLVSPNSAHWMFLQDWQRACPGALTWAAPGLRRRGPVRRSGLRLDRDLGDQAPSEWAECIAQTIVPGGFGFREIAFFHTSSRTLILTDLSMNLEPRKLPVPMRLLMRAAGATAPDGRAPIHLRLVVKLGGAAARRGAEKLVASAPRRLLFSHGAWIERDGTRELKRTLRWLLD